MKQNIGKIFELRNRMQSKNAISIFVLSAIALAFTCGKMAPLKLTEATSTHWAGGIAGRSGTNYVISLKQSTKEKVELDSIWIKGEGTFIIPKDTTMDGEVYMIRKDSGAFDVVVKAFHIYGYPDAEGKTKPENKNLANPFHISAEAAVVAYHCGKNVYYLPVAKFAEKAAIHYP
jgi:hypothetical protein